MSGLENLSKSQTQSSHIKFRRWIGQISLNFSGGAKNFIWGLWPRQYGVPPVGSRGSPVGSLGMKFSDIWLIRQISLNVSGGAKNFIWGLWPRQYGVPPVGSRGSPVGSLRIKSSRSWSSLQTLFTDFNCRNDQNLKITHNSLPDSWVYV